MSSSNTQKYWFPAKRHGWGWGPPSTWQGWVVLVVYLVLVLGGIPFVQAEKGDLYYLGFLVVLTGILILICRITGEP